MLSWRTKACLPSGLVLLALVGLLAGCNLVTATPEVRPTVPASTPVATIAPARQLTICLGQEPASLFPPGTLTPAARSVLSAVYEGPIETNSYGTQPVILQRIPTLANGDARLVPVSVSVGDEVVGADGLPVTLAPGVVVQPSGCRSDGCAVKFDGKSEIQMDQLQVTFRLLPGLTWSDGQPLAADDSVYSYQVAADLKIPAFKEVIDRTQSYQAADPTTVQWSGKPGFIDPMYFRNFWMPLPKHLWSQIPIDQLPDAEIASRTPVGWGPFVIEEWVPGDHISLKKNVHYFRSSRGLPKFDVLTFRFIPDPQAALQALTAGRCDLLDPSIPLDGQIALLQSLSAGGQIKAVFAATPVMEQLAIGIRPSEADNGFKPGVGRPDFFGDARVRQAIALCLDRQTVVENVLYGLSSVPDTYIPDGSPLYDSAVAKYPFNAAAGQQLLEQAGWRQVGDDPSVPRQAYGVPGVPDGTPLVLNYVTTDAAQRVQVSRILAASLAQCGIKINLQYLDAAVLYAPGPQGPLFGRSFDLAEFAIQNTGAEPPCEWYTSPQIPNLANHWVGTDISGYSSPAFDAACGAGRQSLPDDSNYVEPYHQTEAIFSADLPVIPLYWRVEIAATRKDLCNYTLDPTASSSLWSVATLDTSSAGCP